MGYTTTFKGRFELNRPLESHHATYLRTFSETRRMKRRLQELSGVQDPVREAVGLPIGEEGEYFVAGEGYHGQSFSDSSILDYNESPSTQPGLWCQWIPSYDLRAIEWDGGEKFYHYKEWLLYINEHFIRPWGYFLTGVVTWQGEESEDKGIISVHDGVVTWIELTSEDCIDQIDPLIIQITQWLREERLK